MRPKNNERKMKVYNFMTNHMKEHGVYPTVQEIGNRLGMAKSIASKYRNRLIDDGLIEKLGRYQIKAAGNISCSSMPVVGRIACGEPILAIEEIEGYLPIDEGTLGPGEYFGLIADGDSMINAGICEGDTVYVLGLFLELLDILLYCDSCREGSCEILIANTHIGSCGVVNYHHVVDRAAPVQSLLEVFVQIQICAEVHSFCDLLVGCIYPARGLGEGEAEILVSVDVAVKSTACELFLTSARGKGHESCDNKQKS